MWSFYLTAEIISMSHHTWFPKLYFQRIFITWCFLQCLRLNSWTYTCWAKSLPVRLSVYIFWNCVFLINLTVNVHWSIIKRRTVSICNHSMFHVLYMPMLISFLQDIQDKIHRTKVLVPLVVLLENSGTYRWEASRRMFKHLYNHGYFRGRG